MRVVQAVFGVFHHFELGHQLHRRHHLHRIYSTWPWARLKREGLPRDLVRTFPILHTTEYLLGRTNLASPQILSTLAVRNATAFDRFTNSALSREAPPDVFIAISGAGLLTARNLQQRGTKFICDRGSTHQRFQDQIVLAEYQRWGLPAPLPKPHVLIREEAIYAQADAITVPTTIAKRSFIQMGVPASKVHVIPYGVRLDRFHPTEPGAAPASSPDVGPDRESFHLLFAGAVSLRKGIPYLLEAFAKLHHPHKHLTIAGHISPKIRPLFTRLPTDHVTFTGSIPQPELARLMAASHALVLPSVEEGLALVQGQAMACGCPVIATTATGAEDLFTDGVEGFITPDRDVPSLTSRMQQLADDPTLQTSMRSAALHRVKTLGGWNTYGDQWEALVHSL